MDLRVGRLVTMRERSTTVRVESSVRDLLKVLAAQDGVTMDEEVRRLARAERQRRMGRQLAEPALRDEDRAILDAGVDTVRRHARW